MEDEGLAFDAIILGQEIYFLNIPPKKLLEKLRELGLVFDERIILCG